MPNKPIPEKVREIIKKLSEDGFSANYIAKVVKHSRPTIKKYSEKDDE